MYLVVGTQRAVLGADAGAKKNWKEQGGETVSVLSRMVVLF